MAAAPDCFPQQGKVTICDRALELLLEAHRLNMVPVYLIPTGSKVAYSADGDETLLDRIHEVLVRYPDSAVTVSLEFPVV